MRFLAWLSLALLIAAGGKAAHAHDAMSGWAYPVSCCSGVDCAQISAESVQETPAGYVVTVAPGSHPMWGPQRPAPLIVRVAFKEAKPSPDGRFHLCINGQGDLLCFFASIGGS